MSEDERPQRAADLTADLGQADWLALLRTGSLEVLGRMPWSSNGTFLVSVVAGALECRAVYKPGGAERPLRDFPPRIYRREVAAYELSAALELDVVPETVLRSEGPFGEGSLQRFVDADFSEHYFTLFEQGEHEAALRAIAGFDLLLNNADRKGGHILRGPDDHIWGIDNGLSFHTSPKLRTVMWDFAGEAIPEVVIDAAERVLDEVPDTVVALISPSETAALIERAADIRETPVFPTPDPERRAYPWPLV